MASTYLACSSSNPATEYIHYYRRSNYGSEHIYLIDPVLARQVTMLTNKKTVSALDIATLEALTGGEAVEVPAPLDREAEDFDLQTAVRGYFRRYGRVAQSRRLITARAREITPSDFA